MADCEEEEHEGHVGGHAQQTQREDDDGLGLSARVALEDGS